MQHEIVQMIHRTELAPLPDKQKNADEVQYIEKQYFEAQYEPEMMYYTSIVCREVRTTKLHA